MPRLGRYLVALGALSLLLLVGVVASSSFDGTAELSLFGLGLGSSSGRTAMLVVAVLAAVAVAAGFAGAALLVRAQRRGRQTARQDLAAQDAGLEARAHLLEYRAQVLLGHVRDLEAQREKLERSLPTPPAEDAERRRSVPRRAV